MQFTGAKPKTKANTMLKSTLLLTCDLWLHMEKQTKVHLQASGLTYLERHPLRHETLKETSSSNLPKVSFEVSFNYLWIKGDLHLYLKNKKK